jgi:hypothetical protein
LFCDPILGTEKFYLRPFRVSGPTGLSLRKMKDRKKRFYNNVNSKKLKSVEELVTAIATTHKTSPGQEEVKSTRHTEEEATGL